MWPLFAFGDGIGDPIYLGDVDERRTRQAPYLAALKQDLVAGTAAD